ncbi:glycogen synthase GlgA [Thiohalomonas denitrificans]|uniref:glycogen synthase GlgA n=1 Tax=Thiohalomonas denitrificans TaxID=415747 RepID=UPI0026ED0002|nr:glycogen synthase GlgA [Thiohalomonas denitrificans]
MKILFATSEVHPLVKTGGLGDVSAGLPAALHRLGHDVKLVLPAYRRVLDRAGSVKIVARIGLPGIPEPGRIMTAQMPDSGVPLWLVDAPSLYDRAGGPYTDPAGNDWPDNALRFASFARAVVELATDRANQNWKADVVHCNDWQTGLVSALLSRESNRPATVFTIHNMAYQGVFPPEAFDTLHLPKDLWSPEGLEFYGDLSFIKGGIAYADRVTTVSPTYAKEIQQPEFGYGLEGLLSHRAEHLTGILNGVDYEVWDPAHDPLIPHHYTPEALEGKAANKRALQQRFGLPERPEIPLLGVVGRLVDQKGIDLIVDALPELLKRDVQLIVLGSGDKKLEAHLQTAAERHGEQLGVHIGYDETLAHWVEAGADIFLMPSRFEPCGLNQIYSLRYGTLPVVRSTGGLADTVIDADKTTLQQKTATGFVFEQATKGALLSALERALRLFRDRHSWEQMMRAAMAQDLSWERSAARYVDLYEAATAERCGQGIKSGRRAASNAALQRANR